MFFKKNNDKKRINAIKTVIESYRFNDYVLHPYITTVSIDDKTVNIGLRLPKNLDAEQIHRELSDKLMAFGVDLVNMDVVLISDGTLPVQSFVPSSQDSLQQKTPPKPKAQDNLPPHPRIRHIIAVASGKGGVGKSTTAVNLALALKNTGAKVGMLDADIYGPSLPTMLGVAGQKPAVENGQFVPLDGFGMPMISIGSLLDDEHTPIAWRGIKATGALMQLYSQTDFPPLDYLIIDMPPGTGDIALTLAQKIPITCAIIVTTPQHIALLDVKKGIELFVKTHIPVLGVVENMAVYTCKHCGASEPIFGTDGADNILAQYGVPLLGRLPLDGTICTQMDAGDPMPILAYYEPIAQKVIADIGKFSKVRDETRIF